MLSRPVKTKYDKRMFQSRKIINASGFFEPLVAQICKNMLKHRQSSSSCNDISILDAGCGEGSLLSSVQQTVGEQTKHNPLGIGIDIAKEGIEIASRGASRTIWCAADLANCPFANKQFDYILNVLSPSNYSEFQRMLADDGIVIKVVPESGYLHQLRTIFYKKTAKDVYSNELSSELFRRHFQLVDVQRVQYNVVLGQAEIEHLIRMTPLSWGATEKAVRHWLSTKQAEMTCDFKILIGAKYGEVQDQNHNR